MGALVNIEYGYDIRHLRIHDSGDIDPDHELSLEQCHELLKQKVAHIISEGKLPFVIGGGNDQSYANAAGLMDTLDCESVGVINIDAHLDVRPLKEGKVHSGSPFYLLLEDEKFNTNGGCFTEFGVQGSQCSAEHWEYVKSKPNTEVLFLSQVRIEGVQPSFKRFLSTSGKNLFVSFDVDSISSRDCPGVSCPANVGFTSEEALVIAEASGKCKKVKLFDISEYNPDIEEYRTGRLLVLMFYHFLLGYSQRWCTS
eukprot:TRINITY_DN573_c0_g1_i5.p1 TRINITY_DN573_c0_g1~~TRINITY_DN573_c0_g1_i5.p1  ORF type:complete len:255 (-),score=46.92 TRINITY_DN573_c0_g1_i5:117-881(-)